MATMVCFMAHPDDEVITCGGTLAAASAVGHRVVLVIATRGEQGEAAEGTVLAGEELGRRRAREAAAAAEALGVHRLKFLGYVDSGLPGWPTNDAPGSFLGADVEEAARQVASVLAEEGAQVLLIPEENGTTGHPAHVQAHRVGVRAAARAGTARVYEATINRDHVRRLAARADELGLPAPPAGIDIDTLGSPEAKITTVVDVHDYLPAKRAALAAHASQFPETSFFLSLSEAAFAQLWGCEWFIRRDAARGTDATSVVEGLD
jgi:LmbE family N-acetylglucosaminyl deacetylase